MNRKLRLLNSLRHKAIKMKWCLEDLEDQPGWTPLEVGRIQDLAIDLKILGYEITVLEDSVSKRGTK